MHGFSAQSVSSACHRMAQLTAGSYSCSATLHKMRGPGCGWVTACTALLQLSCSHTLLERQALPLPPLPVAGLIAEQAPPPHRAPALPNTHVSACPCVLIQPTIQDALGTKHTSSSHARQHKCPLEQAADPGALGGAGARGCQEGCLQHTVRAVHVRELAAQSRYPPTLCVSLC